MADEPCGCRNGQRHVTEMWARQEAGIDRDTDLAVLERQASEIGQRVLAHHAHPTDPNHPMPDTTLLDRWAKYRANLNTVFPCPTCRPDQFSRWRHGCYQPNHQRKRCRLCKDER